MPEDVTHIIVDRSVDNIRWRAFQRCRRLMSIEIHDDVKIIEVGAFRFCSSLREITTYWGGQQNYLLIAPYELEG